MEKKQHSSKIYEDKGLRRQMFIIKPDSHERLKEVAKRFGLIQGEVLDVLVETADFEALADRLKGMRDAKVAQRQVAPQSAIKKQIASATPDQLAKIQAILAASA